MYESKYKYKHAERRVIPEKAKTFIYRTDPVILKPSPSFSGFASQHQAGLAGLAAQQQAPSNHGGLNAFNGAVVGWPFGGLR